MKDEHGYNSFTMDEIRKAASEIFFLKAFKLMGLDVDDKEVLDHIKAAGTDTALQEISGMYSILTERKKRGENISLITATSENGQTIILLFYLVAKTKEFFEEIFGNEEVADTLARNLLFEELILGRGPREEG